MLPKTFPFYKVAKERKPKEDAFFLSRIHGHIRSLCMAAPTGTTTLTHGVPPRYVQKKLAGLLVNMRETTTRDFLPPTRSLPNHARMNVQVWTIHNILHFNTIMEA